MKKRLAASGCAINKNENLVPFAWSGGKKHKIYIIYATQHALKACFMYVQSMKLASEEKRTFLSLSFIALSPGREEKISWIFRGPVLNGKSRKPKSLFV